ncbi:MAG: hypothetical protein A3F72_09980 [Bacteroidetes bacterium RIFCSPLOWO2_12_FULL_35_15]|nr:MAG: hypothetical protein A3F72_09980 [Bacteroidetes bacterium RIFCSPLOWO2_12_FULL_35_15]
MKQRAIYFFFYLLLIFFDFDASSYAQEPHVIDSLKQKIKTLSNDTSFSYWYDVLAKEYSEINPDSAIIYANHSLALAKKINKPEYQIDALLSLAMIYRHRGEFNTALNHLQNALAIATKHKIKGNYFEQVYSSLNLAYTEQGNYTVGIEYGFKSLHEIEKTGDTLTMALSNNNLANTFFQIKQFEKAMKHYKIALTYAKKINHLYGQALLTGNIGSVYYEIRKLDSAKIYFEQSLNLSRKIDDVVGEATSYLNLGSYYQITHDNKTAIDYFLKSLKIFEEMKMQPNIADLYYNIATSYLEMKEYKKSENYAKKSLEIADQIESYPHKEQAHLALKNVFEKMKNMEQAYYHYKEYILARDTIYNEKNKKEQFKSELIYEYDKKRYTDSLGQVLLSKIQKEELSREKEKTETQKKLSYTALIGFILMLLLALFIYKGYKEKKRSNKIISEQKNKVEIQKHEIEFQKSILETKNKEVTDSINYAKHLQDAILPPLSQIKEHLPDSFILYQPKDIVAGDFYWMEVVDNNILIAAADCTGHGVPGAMVSVVCSNALNRAVKEFGILEPGKILDKVREFVIETFEKSESEVKDGMDISLCLINKNTNELKWSGANNPLWIVRNNELIELKPNKQPIGKIDNPTPFTTLVNKLQLKDSIYLFTDGYADQFGGPKGKKFKYSQLKEELIFISQLSAEKQAELLVNKIQNWKGSFEQVDDILVIGIKL